MDSFKSKDFKRQHSDWMSILKDSGFQDAEYPNGQLKQAETRTNRWHNRDDVRDFFLQLDHLMTHYEEMPVFERKVMVLYSQGVFIKDIVKNLKSTDKYVRNIIRRYKGLVKAIRKLNPG